MSTLLSSYFYEYIFLFCTDLHVSVISISCLPVTVYQTVFLDLHLCRVQVMADLPS